MRKLAEKIIINPEVRFGKPIIENSRITVEEVLGALASGMDFEEIEQEYGLKREDILAAVDYASSFLKNERVESVKTE